MLHLVVKAYIIFHINIPSHMKCEKKKLQIPADLSLEHNFYILQNIE